MRPLRFLAAATAALSLPVVAAAEGGLTLYAGWRASGMLQDEVAARTVRLRARGAFSAALDLPYDASRQLQGFVSRQHTALAVTPTGGGTLRLPVRVDYLHVGGTNFFAGPAGTGPYVAGGIGVTRLAPGLDGFASETRPSMSVALGLSQPLGRHLSLRLQARAYWTLVNGAGGLFCAGGCTILVTGDALSQIETMAGVSLRF